MEKDQENIELVKRFWTKKTVFVFLVVAAFIGGCSVFAVLKASNNPKFCTLCHNMQSYYDSWNNKSNLLANKHKAAGIVNCHDCHKADLVQQSTELVKYVTGNYKDPLDQRQYPKKMCLICHDYEKVKKKTVYEEGNPHASHNGDMECYTCHVNHRQSRLLCAECHQFKWMNKIDDSWIRDYATLMKTKRTNK